jgi:hypothetical protein
MVKAFPPPFPYAVAAVILLAGELILIVDLIGKEY